VTRVLLRPTVAADLPHVIGESLPFRIKALTAYLPADPSRTPLVDGSGGDRVLGVGGLCYMPGDIVGAFVAMTDEGRKYPAAIHRAGLAAMKMIRASGEPRVIAIADEMIPGSERWLARLGFKPVTSAGVTAYVWSAQ